MSVNQFKQPQAVAQFNPEQLRQGSIFAALSNDAIEFLLREGKLVCLLKGEKLFDYGDPGKSFFVVCQGVINISKQHGPHSAHTRSAAFGQEVGFAAMIALLDHAGAAVAQEDSVVLEISAELFARLHKEYPLDFGIMLINLTRDLARLVRKLGNALVDKKSET